MSAIIPHKQFEMTKIILHKACDFMLANLSTSIYLLQECLVVNNHLTLMLSCISLGWKWHHHAFGVVAGLMDKLFGNFSRLLRVLDGYAT